MSELTEDDLQALDDENTERQAARADSELPVRILNTADARPYKFEGHDVVALVIQAMNLVSGELEPFVVLIAPEDAGPLGRRLVSVASPLKPINKESAK